MKAVSILAFVCFVQQVSCNNGGLAGILGSYSGLDRGGTNAPMGWGYGGYRGGYGGYGGGFGG